MLVPMSVRRRGPAQLLGKAHGQRPRPDARMAGPPGRQHDAVEPIGRTHGAHDHGEPSRHGRAGRHCKSRTAEAVGPQGSSSRCGRDWRPKGVAGLKRGRARTSPRTRSNAPSDKRPLASLDIHEIGRVGRVGVDEIADADPEQPGVPGPVRLPASTDQGPFGRSCPRAGWRHPAGGSLF